MAETTNKLTTLEQLKVALLAAKAYVDGEIDGLGALAGKSEVAYDDLAAALKTLIDGKADGTVVATLVGEDTGKSARAISAEEVAKVVANADASFDTLKEIADWILSDTTGAAKMASDIERLDAILDGIGDATAGEKATVVAYVESIIEALNIGQYATTEFVNGELAKKVDKVEGSRLMTNAEGTKLAGIEEGANKTVVYNGLDSTSTTDALSAAQGKALDDKIKAINTNMEDLGAGDMLKSTYDINGDGVVDNAEKLGGVAAADYALKSDLHAHENKAVLDGITAAKVSAWDAAEGNAKSYTDTEAGKLATRIEAVEGTSHTHTYATNDEITAMCTEVFGA